MCLTSNAKGHRMFDNSNPNTLPPEFMIPDQLLRDLAAGDPMRAQGQLSDSDVAVLVMILPDLCGELLARRMAERAAAA